MPAGTLATRTIHELAALRDAGKVSADEIAADLLAAIERLNPAYNAYLPFDRAAVLRRVKDAPKGPLHGIPITIKDNICVAGEETTCASKILEGFRAPYDATVIVRLKAAGAVIIPRANMDEFAFGSSTENSAFGVTRNPWDTSRVPGGSSGGSAAAVAGRLAVAALGSDTGGSIRQPASFCGITGLKPTYGRVSRYGLVAFASSLDQIGPLTRSVEDAALLLSVIAGHDPNDSTSAPKPVDNYAAVMTQGLKGLKVGVPNLPDTGLNPAVKECVDRAVETIKKLGAVPVQVELQHLDKSVETYYITATAEASSNLARFDGVKYGLRKGDGGEHALLDMYRRTRTEGFGAEAKRRILLGTYVLSHGYYDAYYLKGMKVRTLIKQGFDAAFSKCDVVVMPTAPTPAFTIGEKSSDPLEMYLSDIYTISANLAGIPAISVPCGFSAPQGLPIGLQLLAAPFREDTLFRAAYAYQQATDWHTKAPKAP